LTSTRKNCLWRGREFRAKGYNLAAWSLIRRPKAKGGLGVINLSLQNDALLLKQLDFIGRLTSNGFPSCGRGTMLILFLILLERKGPFGGEISQA
jgi:hypothetical protein